MVEAHVAGAAGLGFFRLGLGELVPGVAGVAGGAVGGFGALLRRADADLVTAAAPLEALDVGVGLEAGLGHGVHGDPGQGVLAVGVLVMLLFVALGAGLLGGELDLGDVVGALMVASVTGRAVDSLLAHLPGEEVLDDVGGDLAMAADAGALLRRPGRGGKGEQGQHQGEHQAG
jgi:hypothetical protein